MFAEPGIKLLIVGASNKSTRSIARSLKKHNCITYVLHDADLAVSKSKYIAKYILMQESSDIEVYKNEILQAVRNNKIDVVIPSTDIAVDVIMHFRSEIEKHAVVIGLNEEEIYKYAHNKYELVKLAGRIGLKVPEYVYMTSIDQTIPDLTFPVVIKPVSSARINNNTHFGYKVVVAKTKEQLVDSLRELVPSTPVMIQGFIEGYGIGYNVYCINGEVKSEYIHKRLNENAGVSSYRKIIPVDSYGLKGKVHQLLKEIKWNGVAMVEFKVDHNNIPYLMEMNGRFFGSTELGVKAGYDFPAFLFTDQFNKKPQIVNDTGNFYSLRLLHDEILLEYAALIKSKNILRFLKWKLSLFNLVLPVNFLEDSFFNDPSFVTNLYKYDLKRIALKRSARKSINKIEIKTVTGEQFRNAKNIVFVCRGNICRSPFAEYYSKNKFPGKDFASTGTYSLQNRYSPMNAINAAAALGVDLTEHQSKVIDIEQREKTDFFIVMDKLNYHELIQLGIPENKIYFLSGKEIADPYKKDTSEFRNCYLEIKNAIDKLR
jgi:predicted ATP-grasp superfamily ATP-dependent carboligase/protein-tyrosine-phosphatase